MLGARLHDRFLAPLLRNLCPFPAKQACTFICPYGRFQSVLLDENSIVVAYDYLRGERRAAISISKRSRAASRPATASVWTAINASPSARPASISATVFRWNALTARLYRRVRHGDDKIGAPRASSVMIRSMGLTAGATPIHGTPGRLLYRSNGPDHHSRAHALSCARTSRPTCCARPVPCIKRCPTGGSAIFIQSKLSTKTP